MCFMFVQGERSFILLRVLLGVTEAGLFPGVITFLAAWFPNNVRVQMFAIFYLAQPLSQLVGAPPSGVLINPGEKMPGIAGWQLMFVTEGLLAVLAGIAAFFFLINGPQDAKFLDPVEKAALLEVMALEDTVRVEVGPSGVWAALRNGRVWYFTIVYFCLQIAVYGVTFFLPQQVAEPTGQKVGLKVGLLVAIPWFFAIFSTYFIGRKATTMTRRRNLGVWLFVSTGLCIFGSAWAGFYPTAFLTGTAAAAGIGLINSLGNTGGFVAPILRTQVNALANSATGSVGVYALGILPFLAALLMYGTKWLKTRADDLLDVEARVEPLDPELALIP